MQKCNTPDPVLDAARATVLEHGVRRATLTEVARRAGLSRMTVYRRYTDAPQLMRALMSREFRAVLVEAEVRAMERPEGRERVVAVIVGTVELLGAHPLLLRLLELEPEILVPYLVVRLGEFQAAARAVLASWIAEAQATGTIAAGDPGTMAGVVELTCRGPVLATRTMTGPEREAALAELERMLVAYLSPEA